MIPTWVVVPSNGRPFLEQCIESLRNQVDKIIIVQNGGEDFYIKDEKIIFVPDTGTDLNISRWWNIGIDFVENNIGTESWNTLVVNDDIIACHNLVESLSRELRMTTAVLAYPNQFDNHRFLHRNPGPIDLHHRITGYCYMLRGETKMRLDETMVWWYSDDNLDWECRVAGGSLLVPWCKVQHRAPDGTFLVHPELHVQAANDRKTFVKKWGKAPW